MNTESKNFNLVKYSHNRSANYKTTIDEIFNLVNDYAELKELSGLYSYFDKKYQLPDRVVKQKIKQYISRSYLFESRKFNTKLNIKNMPKSILRYVALVYALIFSKRKTEVKKFKLIIDDIYATHELDRFKKLLNLVGQENTLCVTRGVDIKRDFSGVYTYNQKKMQNFNLSDVLHTLANEFLIGIWTVLKASLRTRVNLFPVAFNIICSYLSSKSLFSAYQADFLIQERHYYTDSVKNYLFKKFGGVASTSIQKNIFQSDPICFYMDIDIFFSLGKKSHEGFLDYGGRIDNISPIGSMFMEYYWFRDPKKSYDSYDILLLGQNISNAYERENKFSEFMTDYYDCFRWLVRFKSENPNYSIAIMHHSSAGIDLIEKDILKDSNITILDKSDNTYKAAFAAKCNVTYGSTMGYELIGHNIPSIFMDPGYRCTFLPHAHKDKSNKVNLFRTASYEKFSALLLNILREKNLYFLYAKNFDDMCLNNSRVSEKIYKKLKS